MPTESQEATFEEVLKVSINLGTFKADLQQMKAAYEGVLTDMSKSNVNLGGIGSALDISGLSKSVSEMSTELSALAIAFKESFSSVQQVVQATVGSNGAAIAQSAKSTNKQLEEADGEYTAITKRGLQDRLNALEEYQSLEVEAKKEAVEKMSASDQVYAANQFKTNLDTLRGQIATLNEGGPTTTPLQEYQKARAAQEEADQQARLSAFGKLESQQRAFYDKSSALEEKDSKRQKDLQDQVAANAESDYDKILAAAEKNQAAITASNERAGEEKVAADNRRLLSIVGPPQSLGSRFMTGLSMGGDLGDLAQMAGSVTRFSLAWGAVGMAVDAVRNSFEAIVESFKSGITYLESIQDSSVLLAGVLVKNVQFAGDLKDQFREASVYAQAISREVLDVATASNLDPKQFQESLNSAIGAGITRLAPDFKQQIEIINEMSLAVKATGADGMAIREAFRDLPSLIDGSVTSSSHLLQILGMTADQWKTIRQQALEHHNLLELLQPILGGIAEAEKAQSQTLTSTTAQLSLTISEIMADVDKPIFEKWIQGAQELNKWLKDNKDQAHDIVAGTTIGTIIGAVAGTATGAFIGHPILGGMAGAALGSGAGGVAGHEYAAHASDIDTALSWIKATLPLGSLGPLGGLRPLPPGISSQMPPDNFPSIPPRVNASDLLSAPMIAKFHADPVPADTFDRLFSTYSQKVEDTKAKEQELRDSTKQMMTDRTMSVSDGTNIIVASFNREASEINTYKDQAMSAAKTIGGSANSTAVNKFDARVNKSAESSSAALDKGRSAAIQANMKDQQGIISDGYKAQQKLAEDNANATLAIYQQQTSEGYHTQSEYIKKQIDVEKQLQTDRENIYKQERDDAGVNVRDVEKIWNQLVESRAQSNARLKALDEQQQEALRNEAQQTILDVAHNSALPYQTANVELQGKAQMVPGDPVKQNQIAAQAAQNSLKIAESDANAAMVSLTFARSQDQKAQALNAVAQAIQRVISAQSNLDAINAKPGAATTAAHPYAENFSSHLFGSDDAGNPFKSLGEAFKSAKTSVEALGTAFKAASGVFNDVKAGYEQGGILGGAGAGLSDVGSMVGGEAGAVMGGIGSIISTIGDLFRAASQRIAEQATKDFQNIQNAYSNGTLNLSAAIKQEQDLINNTISQLSGQKGGQDELNKILPGMQNALASLQQQAKQIIASFNEQAASLSLNNSSLQSFAQSWSQVNQQVTQYVNAGGSIATATKFMSDSLQQLKEASELQNNTNETQAVNDALQLNDLLQQRVQLIQQEKEQEFALTTADAIERRVAPGVAAAQALAQQQAQYQQQLDNLNYQVTLQQQKTDMETKFYGIATDINDLQTLGAQLQQTALDNQLKQWQGIQEIVNGITQSGGQWGLTSAFNQQLASASNPNVPGTAAFGGINPVVNIGTINVGGDPTTAAGRDEIAKTITDAMRSGVANAYSTSGYSM